MAYHHHATNGRTPYRAGDAALCFNCGQSIVMTLGGIWIHPDGFQWKHDQDNNGKIIGQHMAYPQTNYPRQLEYPLLTSL